MSGISNYPDINETFIIEPMFLTGGSTTFSACSGFYTNMVISCDGDSYIELLSGQTVFNTDIVPEVDNITNLGTQLKRFRDINMISGTTTVWNVTNTLTTPNVNLGLDSSGESRIITADSSVLQNDILYGGIY